MVNELVAFTTALLVMGGGWAAAGQPDEASVRGEIEAQYRKAGEVGSRARSTSSST